MKGIELVSSFPFSGFFVQPVDGCPILVAVRQCNQFWRSVRVFFQVRDVERFSVVFVLPVEERTALGSSSHEL